MQALAELKHKISIRNLLSSSSPLAMTISLPLSNLNPSSAPPRVPQSPLAPIWRQIHPPMTKHHPRISRIHLAWGQISALASVFIPDSCRVPRVGSGDVGGGDVTAV
ncbi:hypothetical protein NUU61_008435 [Penicillium alfredii]|uniref:Uncharacterized protein n=1 Tax=Penicillium alfredii TaxID=1506179 RepID=A0A9W9EL58_9EURO|nr:uncharacterized protein NUU61_008435 [Penicillium alfredii]KAJ5083856.1 hypothetical protein NUU61_008435 [Penicillium alfredii]